MASRDRPWHWVVGNTLSVGVAEIALDIGLQGLLLSLSCKACCCHWVAGMLLSLSCRDCNCHWVAGTALGIELQGPKLELSCSDRTCMALSCKDWTCHWAAGTAHDIELQRPHFTLSCRDRTWHWVAGTAFGIELQRRHPYQIPCWLSRRHWVVQNNYCNIRNVIVLIFVIFI